MKQIDITSELERFDAHLANNARTILSARLQAIDPKDKVFIACYGMFLGQIVLGSRIPNDIYVWEMGWEMYTEPFWFNAAWVYDKYTLKFIKKTRGYGYPLVNWKRKPNNCWKIYDEICLRLVFMPKQRQLYQQKLRTMRCVNYIIQPKVGKKKFELPQKLYPGCSFRLVHGILNQNYDADSKIPTKVIQPNQLINLLLCNSADPTNNYLDAFMWLEKQIRKLSRPIKIFAILLCGDPRNRDEVIKEGKRIFGDIFEPITTFMGRYEYIPFINAIDVFVMYHNRQQACGNIMTAVILSKPVLMKNCSPIYQMIHDQGCSSVYDVADVSFANMEDIIQRCS
ncbi:MAG: hypothetical protein ACI4TV_04755 [Paludibacteraceae bacterium]